MLDDNAVGSFVQESIDSYLVPSSVRRIIIEREGTRADEIHAFPVGRVH